MPDPEYTPQPADEEFLEQQDTIERMNWNGWKYSGSTLDYRGPDEPEK